jgi:hypothetical protein
MQNMCFFGASTLFFCALTGFYEDLFDVCAPASAYSPQKVHVFMNQRDVIGVAKFVQWLRHLVLDSLEVPTDQ